MKVVVFLLVFCGICALSYGVTYGIIYLICRCFSWAFSWKIALGVWLALLLVKSTLSGIVQVKGD